MTIESQDPNLAVGQAPAYAWSDSQGEWKRLRCNSQGELYVSPLPLQAAVFVPDQAGDTVHTGTGVMHGIVNNTSSALKVLDDTTQIGLVLPMSQMLLPLVFTTSLVIESTVAVLSGEISVHWRSIT